MCIRCILRHCFIPTAKKCSSETIQPHQRILINYNKISYSDNITIIYKLFPESLSHFSLSYKDVFFPFRIFWTLSKMTAATMGLLRAFVPNEELCFPPQGNLDKRITGYAMSQSSTVDRIILTLPGSYWPYTTKKVCAVGQSRRFRISLS